MRKHLLPILLLLSCAAAAARTDQGCFKDGDSYMTETYGAAYREDENLVIKQERYGKQVYEVARDKTSGTNHLITLLLQRPGKGLCKILTTYPVVGITPIDYDRQGRPIAFSAKDQGTTSHEIIYRWDQAGAEFKPAKCTEQTWTGQRMKSRTVACASLLEQ